MKCPHQTKTHRLFVRVSGDSKEDCLEHLVRFSRFLEESPKMVDSRGCPFGFPNGVVATCEFLVLDKEAIDD